MRLFECPSCNTKWQADDNAGKTSVCPACARMATQAAGPLSLPPLTAVTTPEIAEAAEKAKAKWHGDDGGRDTFSIAKDGGASWTRMQLCLYVLVAIAVVAILIALLVPSVEKVRGAAARTQSINNLKQIVLAAHGFHDANKRLPFNGTGPAVGGDSTSGSWAFQLLPFIDSNPWFNDPVAGRKQIMHVYRCPGRDRSGLETTNGGGTFTDYFINNYLSDPKQANQPNNADIGRTLKSITDDTSNTVFAGHGNINTDDYKRNANVALSCNIFLGGTTGTMRAGNNGEQNPAGVTLQRDSDQPPTVGSWGGPFPQGALIGMCDGTVRVLPYSTQNFGAFLTPTGGEAVVLPDS